MKIEKTKRILNLVILVFLIVGFLSPAMYAEETENNQNDNQENTDSKTGSFLKSGGSQMFGSNAGALGSVVNLLGGGIDKLFGASPVVHGLIGGAISGISTYSNLKKEVDFKVTKDVVNISDKEEDYLDKENMDNKDYSKYGDQLYENRIMGQENDDFDPNTMRITITDQNTLDTEFIKTSPLNELDTSNSPDFRLAEETDQELIYNLDKNSVEGQKRGILFTDPEKTIKNSYEYRSLVLKYPKAEYEDNLNIKLKTVDLLGKIGENFKWEYLLKPFSSGKDYLNLDRVENNPKLKEEVKDARTVDDVLQNFHLQFNSWTEDENDSLELSQLDCVTEGGLALGTTGEEILPKVAFDWEFDTYESTATAINGNQVPKGEWCDVNPNDETKKGIYCDSTQFTIELLNKVNKIQDYVEQHESQFICPTPGIEREIITDVNNIGISELNSVYDGVNKVNVNFKIEGGFERLEISENRDTDYVAKLELELIEESSSNVLDTKTISIRPQDIRDSDFIGSEELSAEFYSSATDLRLEANILNFKPDYEDLDMPGDNQLINEFSTEAPECDLEHTSQNIKHYAKNVSPSFEDETLVNFRSLLMKDGYSYDFVEDFDDYYRTNFMEYPQWYYNDTTQEGLYKYVRENDKFSFTTAFESEPGQLVLPGPGRYEVQLNITFNDDWELFDDQGNIVGDIEVYLTKELPPEMDAPVYYMPFDGLVGINSPNARQGYGMDYIGDVIDLDHEIGMRSEPFTSSNSVNTLNVKEYGNNPGDFAFMNNNQTRGMILGITTSSTHNNPELNYVPSRATPVVMQVDNQEIDAYSFYKLTVGSPEAQGGEPAQPGTSLTKWTGVGECKDFTGISVQEAFLNRPDMLATQSSLAPYTPSQTFAYGVEWSEDQIIRKGSVFLRSVLYTPSNFTTGNGMSVLYADAYSDNVKFYSPNSQGKQVELPSVFNEITSLKQTYDLVAEKKACINYSSTNMEVYYNPNAIAKELFGGDTSTETQQEWIESNSGTTCITE